MWTANILVVNHALFMSDLALRAAGASLLPEYDVAIFDEAHTLEAVAGEHLGCGSPSGQVEYALNRLYNDRTRKGLLVYHELDEAIEQVQRARYAAARLLRRRRRLAGAARARPTAGSGSRSAWPDTLGEELRKLATAIGQGAEAVEEEEQRIELTAAAGALRRPGRDRSSRGCARTAAESVYWIEVERGLAAAGHPRLRPARRRPDPRAASCSTGCRPAS